MSQSSHLNISYQKFLITDRQTATAFQATERRQFVFQQVNSQQSAVSSQHRSAVFNGHACA